MNANNGIRDPIPENATIDEMVEFWETHSLADYEDVLEEVEFEYVGPIRAKVARYLWENISVEARRQGVDPETLINLWLVERLNDERRPQQMGISEVSDDILRKKVGAEVAVLAEARSTYRAKPDS